jgi:hypothetical protein
MAKRTALDLLVTAQSLSIVSGSFPFEVADRFIENAILSGEPLGPDVVLKNVCAKVSEQLSQRIDNVVNFLGVSKRRFLEAAFIDAVEKSIAIMKTEGVFEVIGELEDQDREGKVA